MLDAFAGVELDEAKFLELLKKVMSESEHVQNDPKQGFIPQEGLVAAHLVEALKPFSEENGGPLKVELLTYKEGRPNVKITYPGTDPTRTLGFIGSHMDVVPANPESWDRNPFELTIEGDKLHGRGATDCLGHCVMVTMLMAALGEHKPVLERSVVALFIAGEEGAEAGVGVDMVVNAGKIDELKNGPVVWIDSADSQPCVGTAGVLQWHLKATGRLFHSGLPHRGINSLELVNEACAEIQKRFYKDFPAHPDEKKYNFSTCSTMKPTQIEIAKGSLNQLPPWTKISGDIRLTPFYDAGVVYKTVLGYVDDLNANIGQLPTRGPCSKYTLDLPDVDIKQGLLELEFSGGIEDIRHMGGIACNLESPGLAALTEAFKAVRGKGEPYAITGSLPLVREMQAAGFDLQITGFGLSSTYHADNEYVLLSDIKDAFLVLLRVISAVDKTQELPKAEGGGAAAAAPAPAAAAAAGSVNAEARAEALKAPEEGDVPTLAEKHIIYDDDAAIGKKAPTLGTLDYIKGEPVVMGKGKPVCIVFWSKAYKGDYTTLRDVSKIHDVFGDDIQFLGIGIDPTKEDAESFLKKIGTKMPEIYIKQPLKVNFPLAYDTELELKGAFKATAEMLSLGASAVFLVDGDRRIVWREQFAPAPGHMVAKGLLQEQCRRLILGEALVSCGARPVEEEEEEEEMDMGGGDDDFDW